MQTLNQIWKNWKKVKKAFSSFVYTFKTADLISKTVTLSFLQRFQSVQFWENNEKNRQL